MTLHPRWYHFAVLFVLFMEYSSWKVLEHETYYQPHRSFPTRNLPDTKITRHKNPDTKNYNRAMRLVHLDNYSNARCLDGTHGAYYYAKGTNDKWVFFMEGGGWCTGKKTCYERITSMPGYGGSRRYLAQENAWHSGGPFASLDCLINPTFCGAHFVYLKYCDGTYFSGDVESVSVNGTLMYFRGKAIREAVFDSVLRTTSLASATEVVLTGTSAGGLSALLHADTIGDWILKNVGRSVKYGVIPNSGFPLLQNNVLGETHIQDQLKGVFDTSHARSGINAECVRRTGDDAWKCMFPEYLYPHTRARIFLIHSEVDTNHIHCHFLTHGCNAAPGYSECHLSEEGGPQCPRHLFGPIRGYQRAFRATALAATAHSPRNGAYLHSCFTHCGDCRPKLLVNGTRLSDAVSRWWRSAPGPHVYTDCNLLADAPHPCNAGCALHE